VGVSVVGGVDTITVAINTGSDVVDVGTVVFGAFPQAAIMHKAMSMMSDLAMSLIMKNTFMSD